MYARQALKLSFPSPGFFLVDARVVVRFDGDVVHEGGCEEGFELELPVSPGRHTLTTTIVLGAIERRRTYSIDVIAGQARWLGLRYSRVWGNFTRELVVVGQRPAPSAPGFRWALAALAFVTVSPVAAFLVFGLAVTVAPPVTPDGNGVMPTGQLLLALVLAPFVGAGTAVLVGRTRRR